MLDSIFEMLKNLVDSILSFFEFVVKLVKDLVYVIELVGETVADIPNYFSWFPTELLAILLPIFAIVVIYKILGRD